MPHIHVAVRSAERDLLVTQADLDKVVARRAAVMPDGLELIRFDVVMAAAA